MKSGKQSLNQKDTKALARSVILSSKDSKSMASLYNSYSITDKAKVSPAMKTESTPQMNSETQSQNKAIDIFDAEL